MTEASLKERVREELRIYAYLSLYLYVCFAALLAFEATSTGSGGGGLLPHGLAAIKALVIGKFVLIGRAVGAGSRVRTGTVAGRIGVRTLGLLLALLVLTVIEEMIVGKVHGHAVSSTLAEIFGHPRFAILAKSAVMTLVLLPLVALEELNAALGPGVLRKALLGRPA
jgi:hypothetical protein